MEDDNRTKNAEIVVTINFWRTFDIPLINCEVSLTLTWVENCVIISNATRDGNLDANPAVARINNPTKATFKITDTKLYVPVVTLSTQVINNHTNIYELLSASFQGVKRLFFLAYDATGDDNNNEAGIKNNKRYFLPRAKIENYKVLIDGRHFYDQPINDLMKQYDEVRKVSIGQGGDYTTGCLFDYAYFKDNYRLIEVDLSK